MKKFVFNLLIVLMICGCSKEENVDSALEGSWKLQSIEADFVQSSPEDEVISVTFEEEVYTGRTEANEFGGDYITVDDSLFLTNSYTSEVAETEWGLRFYEALREAYEETEERSKFLYILDDDRLVLRNEEENMIFEVLE